MRQTRVRLLLGRSMIGPGRDCRAEDITVAEDAKDMDEALGFALMGH